MVSFFLLVGWFLLLVEIKSIYDFSCCLSISLSSASMSHVDVRSAKIPIFDFAFETPGTDTLNAFPLVVNEV